MIGRRPKPCKPKSDLKMDAIRKLMAPILRGEMWGGVIRSPGGLANGSARSKGIRSSPQLGMFHDDSIALYQSVETRATHRRRGICSALLRHAALWALGRAPNAVVVIVAEADTDEGRLYCKMGFAHSETIYGIVQDGY